MGKINSFRIGEETQFGILVAQSVIQSIYSGITTVRTGWRTIALQTRNRICSELFFQWQLSTWFNLSTRCEIMLIRAWLHKEVASYERPLSNCSSYFSISGLDLKMFMVKYRQFKILLIRKGSESSWRCLRCHFVHARLKRCSRALTRITRLISSSN
jgi:hypothetical protein